MDQAPSNLQRIRQQPWLLGYGLRGVLGGLRCKLWHGLIRRKLKAGRTLRVYGKAHFIGPGKITLGDNVHILGDAIKPACFLTTSPDAVITVGDHTGINGTSFSAAQRITIGSGCAIAAHLITDSTNHPTTGHPITDPDAPIDTAPVTIGDHAFIAAQTVVTHGSTVGNHTVIGACSLVRGDVPANVFAAGNPLKVIRPVGQGDATEEPADG